MPLVASPGPDEKAVATAAKAAAAKTAVVNAASGLRDSGQAVPGQTHWTWAWAGVTSACNGIW